MSWVDADKLKGEAKRVRHPHNAEVKLGGGEAMSANAYITD